MAIHSPIHSHTHTRTNGWPLPCPAGSNLRLSALPKDTRMEQDLNRQPLGHWKSGLAPELKLPGNKKRREKTRKEVVSIVIRFLSPNKPPYRLTSLSHSPTGFRYVSILPLRLPLKARCVCLGSPAVWTGPFVFAEGRVSGVWSVDNLPSLCLGHLAHRYPGRHH